MNIDIAEKTLQLKQDFDEVYEAGKKAEYDAFWDTFQQNGNRKDYSGGYGGHGWTDELFLPKYDMQPTNAYMMFRSTNIKDLRNLPVKLDFSKTTNFQYMFQWANTKYVGIIDTQETSSGSALTSAFAYTYSLKSIEKLILKDDGSQSLSGVFDQATALEEINIEGVIGSSVNFKDCTKLIKASFTSIIKALSTTKSGLSATFSKTAVNSAFGIDIDDVTTYPEGSEFYTLRHSRDNWTFNYV